MHEAKYGAHQLFLELGPIEPVGTISTALVTIKRTIDFVIERMILMSCAPPTSVNTRQIPTNT